MGNYWGRHFEDKLSDAYPKLMARVKYIQFNVYGYRDDEEAIDLCQDTCLRCWEKRDDYDQTKSFNAWARKILDNIFIDKIRRNIRYREIIEDIEEVLTESVRNLEVDTTDEINLMIEYQKCIELLNEKEYEAFYLQMGGASQKTGRPMTQEQLGKLLGINSSTAGSLLCRAKKTVGDCLETQLQEV